MKKMNYKRRFFTSTNILYTLLVCLLLINIPACAQRNVSTASISYNISSAEIKLMQDDILKLVNQYRSNLGLRSLQMNDVATSEATKHSADMAKGRMDFGHDGFDERKTNLYKKVGGITAIAENVAYGKINAQQVMDMWLSSPGHKKNIEGNYSMMGIGIVQSKSGYLYFTQIFLLK
jgi:uncharacterized protein YkwD